MDYRNIFQEKDTVTSDDFVCTCFRQGGLVHLTHNGNYPMLFVLRGCVALVCKGVAEQTLLSGDMVLVSRRKIAAVYCQDETILMEYTLPEALTVRFQQHPTCFAQPSQPVVPITGRLGTWVEQQLQPRPDESRSQNKELLALLVKYQKHRLRTICEIIKEYISTSC